VDLNQLKEETMSALTSVAVALASKPADDGASGSVFNMAFVQANWQQAVQLILLGIALVVLVFIKKMKWGVLFGIVGMIVVAGFIAFNGLDLMHLGESASTVIKKNG
jgi:hypothetical protein